ncbi:unnamed protein product [Adineta steineri]|uniref:Uncharacterized protein n=1 Tax=Adineta steineri TaxID=433720 RepID=A0A818UPU6_9BILA|nr:unnamed protein product [Adineta steineri]CAF3700068.1 unnamed protein product [Adineta steineri]
MTSNVAKKHFLYMFEPLNCLLVHLNDIEMLDFTNLSRRQARYWVNFLYFILAAVTWILVILAGICQAQRSSNND